LVDEVVDEESIAKIVAKLTGIPVSRIEKGDREKVLDLKATLEKRVIGQDEAITLVSNAILRQRAGIKNPNRPIGSFLFLGPTGVGKTEVAGPWPKRSSTTKTTSSASICRNIWKSTRSRA
jgi:ATP-dependent Clp protease ATP-binding subunit ClpB